LFKNGILKYFNSLKPNELKHKRAMKLGMRILAIIPKLVTNKAKTLNDNALKTNNVKAIRLRLKVTKTPFCSEK